MIKHTTVCLNKIYENIPVSYVIFKGRLKMRTKLVL